MAGITPEAKTTPEGRTRGERGGKYSAVWNYLESAPDSKQKKTIEKRSGRGPKDYAGIATMCTEIAENLH